MCSGFDGPIGPPLHAKSTGRVAGSAPSAAYAKLTMRAAGWPAAFGTIVSFTVAVYDTFLPLKVPSWCVTAGGYCDAVCAIASRAPERHAAIATATSGTTRRARNARLMVSTSHAL